MESRFKKYRQILSDEAKKARSGEKSKIFNDGNITAAILFIGCISVWSFYSVIKPSQKSEEFTDYSKVLKVVFFDVGQGDSALLILPSKKMVLIDAGGKPGYVIEESEGTSEEKEDAAKNLIIPYLTKELGLQTTNYELLTINYFIATHPHTDHYGGFVTLMENKITPSVVYDAGFAKSYPLYETFLQQIKDSKAKYVIPAVGETVDLGGGVLMKFLGPLNKYRGTKSDENNSSIVLKIIYGNVSFLFTGDVELEAENDLVGWRGELKSTILKVAHHGSRTSTTSPFLDRVSPDIAIISAGRGNTFGHPAAETLKKLVDRNTNIYRTDQNGTITLLTDGTSLKITTER
ncbi:MAG: MBL fold metallo-hydrolase [Elusimicrobia bacterium]|nr:MBL fold metallo-hydrolase [Elusimicrobiota bacterium]